MKRTLHASGLFVVVTAVCLGGLGGCVERELEIDSQPQGALVYLNGEEFGRTPLTRDFLWYGTYDVVLRKEGYDTLKTKAPVMAPIWQWVPIDLVAEVSPAHYRDRHKLNFVLKPETDQTADPDTLVRRGVNLRDQLEFGAKQPKEPKAASTKPAKKPGGKATTKPTKPPTMPTTMPTALRLPTTRP